MNTKVYGGITSTTGMGIGDRMYLVGDGTNEGDSWFSPEDDPKHGFALAYHQIVGGKEKHVSQWDSRGFDAIKLATGLNSVEIGELYAIGGMGNRMAFYDHRDGETHVPVQSTVLATTFDTSPIIRHCHSDHLADTHTMSSVLPKGTLYSTDNAFTYIMDCPNCYMFGFRVNVESAILDEETELTISLKYDNVDGIEYYSHTTKGAITAGDFDIAFLDEDGHARPSRNSSSDTIFVTISCSSPISLLNDEDDLGVPWVSKWEVTYEERFVATEDFVHNTLLGQELGALMSGEVEYYANLPAPDAVSVPGKIYRVNKRTANYWTLGVTSRYVAGYYESDGTDWLLKPNAALPVYNDTYHLTNTYDTRGSINYRQYTPEDISRIAGTVNNFPTTEGNGYTYLIGGTTYYMSSNYTTPTNGFRFRGSGVITIEGNGLSLSQNNVAGNMFRFENSSITLVINNTTCLSEHIIFRCTDSSVYSDIRVNSCYLRAENYISHLTGGINLNISGCTCRCLATGVMDMFHLTVYPVGGRENHIISESNQYVMSSTASGSSIFRLDRASGGGFYNLAWNATVAEINHDDTKFIKAAGSISGLTLNRGQIVDLTVRHINFCAVYSYPVSADASGDWSNWIFKGIWQRNYNNMIVGRLTTNYPYTAETAPLSFGASSATTNLW